MKERKLKKKKDQEEGEEQRKGRGIQMEEETYVG